MPFWKVELDNGEVYKVEADTQPTPEEVMQNLGQQSQEEGIFTKAEFPEQQQEKTDLDMSLGEKVKLRGKLAFGDDPVQVQKFLQEEYPDKEIKLIHGRKFSIDGVPIDPLSFSTAEMLLDVVDVSDELVRLGGQIFGATKGGVIGTAVAPGPGTVAGTLIGGVAGRASGQLAVEAIGRGFGVQGNEEFGKIAQDIAREGAVGAIGEAYGLGIRAISRPTSVFLRNIFNKIQHKFSQPAIQNLFNFTAGIEKSSIQRIQERGANAILTRENMSDDALLRLGEKIQSAAIEQRKILGQAVKTGKGIIKSKVVANIDISDLKHDFAVSLQDLDLLNSNFKPLKPIVGKIEQSQKEILSIFNFLKDKKNISPNIALRLRNKIDTIIDYAKTGDRVISTKEESALSGLRKALKEKLIQVSDEFAEANKRFEAFSDIEDALKGKLDLDTIEAFLKKVYTGHEFYKEYLSKLSNSVTPKKAFIQKLSDVIAARDFASGTFRGIRSGLLRGAIGTLVNIPAVLGLPTGVAISTPRAVGELLKGQQATGKILEYLIKKGGQQVQEKSAPGIASLLSQLLSK